jgi:hypothetical protein
MENKEDNKKNYKVNKKEVQNLKSILQAIRKKETAKTKSEPTIFSLQISHLNTYTKHNYHKTHRWGDINGTIEITILS